MPSPPAALRHVLHRADVLPAGRDIHLPRFRRHAEERQRQVVVAVARHHRAAPGRRLRDALQRTDERLCAESPAAGAGHGRGGGDVVASLAETSASAPERRR